MNIRFSLLVLSLIIMASETCSAQPPLYTPKQKTVVLLNSIKEPVWHSTAPAAVTDPIFVSQATTNALPGLPATTTFFFSRTPHVINIRELVRPAAFDETTLQPFTPYGYALELQQHTFGIQVGQLWAHENLEMGWQWWVGAQERNWWLTGDMRAKYQETLKHYTSTPTRNAQLNTHAPQEPEHRLTLWHGISSNVGIGDVHLQARYRAHLTNWFSCSLGGYITVPVGTKAHRTTPIGGDDSLPVETDELGIRVINRVRDIMLCTPLGKSGHLGLGFQSNAQLFLTRQWSVRGMFTQVHYLAGIENRYALTPLTAQQKLEEGLPGTMEGISSNETIIQHLKHTLYPCEIKTHIQPGLFRLATAGLHYENIPFHCALSYGYEVTMPEYSESAPLATLRRLKQDTHRLNLLAGLRKCFQWGQSSTYAQGHYNTGGTHAGAWGFGVGITVQA